MNLEQAVLEKLRELPLEKQQEVLDFTNFLHQQVTSKRPLGSVKGLWADLNFDLSDEDIAQARKEMWGNFPRDIE